MRKLEGKTAVVTGAASGMGAAIAGLFAAEGARIVAADLDQSGIDSIVDSIKAKGGQAVGIIVNVAREEDVARMIETAVSKYGSLDILVNNAGIMDDFMPIESVTNELWERVMKVNVNGPMYACRLAVPIMLNQGKGAIINIASVGGLEGARAGATYTASKHALVGLTKNIGFMYAQKGIRCNAIAPGGVNTNIGKNMNPHPFGYERCTSGGVSMPRMGDSIEIASVALFLAGDESSFVNASVLTADGGWTAY